jgi:hypothetical protein
MMQLPTDAVALKKASGESMQMVTRRTVLGAGLAFASVATCSADFAAHGTTGNHRRAARSIDALLIDDTIEMPRRMAAFIQASSGTVPIVPVRLDAAAHAGLIRLLGKSQSLVGISSGATLFCVERIAWDHGLRLTARSERVASETGNDAWRHDVAAYLSGAHPPAASSLTLARAYRPSRADGTLHVWALQKPVRPQLRQDRREVST